MKYVISTIRLTIETNFTPITMEKTAQNSISNYTLREMKKSYPKVSLGTRPHFLLRGFFPGS